MNLLPIVSFLSQAIVAGVLSEDQRNATDAYGH